MVMTLHVCTHQTKGVMTWSYTGDVGMMHLVIPFFLQIAVGDAIVQVASLWE
jgi:hypothetical protein